MCESSVSLSMNTNTTDCQDKLTLDDGCEVQVDVIIVLGTATSLLGKTAAELLGILQVVVYYLTGSDGYGNEWIRHFPKLWNGIGCSKGVQVRLYINISVTPMSYKHSHVPFHK